MHDIIKAFQQNHLRQNCGAFTHFWIVVLVIVILVISLIISHSMVEEHYSVELIASYNEPINISTILETCESINATLVEQYGNIEFEEIILTSNTSFGNVTHQIFIYVINLHNSGIYEIQINIYHSVNNHPVSNELPEEKVLLSGAMDIISNYVFENTGQREIERTFEIEEFVEP